MRPDAQVFMGVTVLIHPDWWFWIYIALAAITGFGAFNVWVLWWELRTLLLLVHGITRITMTFILCLIAIILSPEPVISRYLLVHFISALFLIWTVVTTISADMILARHNGHRAFTTRSYLWYLRVTGRNRDQKADNGCNA